MLFAAGKDELGLAHSPLMSAHAVLRVWTLVMLASVFLEEERHRMATPDGQWRRPAPDPTSLSSSRACIAA
jgi:hypothetical protein